ncbi:hypothetical protein [Caulobacter sp. 17J80-11]|uniref:CC_3452 family protein n=1 Tax=Caulobacter sp. 17J80-11 TaxID=2763502 RepID=UPI0016539BA3|nr:hypothetical protein [Caulobacter sp. 17J80-11]MBC6981781.1 hypothetical protein [Caulobacter sp. 17J80-11]
MRAIALSLALSLAAAGAAAAQGGETQLTLQNGEGAAAKVIVDGTVWKCEGVTCVAGGSIKAQPAARACKRVVAKLGTVSAFSWRGEALSGDALAECNAAAKA